MVMAFDEHEPGISTERILGEVYEIDGHGGFSGWLNEAGEASGFNPTTHVSIHAESIAEAVQHRVVRGALFYCDVELLGEEVHTIRGIEFIESETMDLESLEMSARKWAFLAGGDTSDDPDD